MSRMSALVFADTDWGAMNRSLEGSSIMTMLGITEGHVLTQLEEQGSSTIQEVLAGLNLPATLVLMAIGALVRQKLVLATKMNADILLERLHKSRFKH